ncbi:polysaccharide deacetylase family protein [Streptomyces clavuligerus]|uniref:Polysaccharide deacetylase n=1 Tax=Streptomyces clavuligerus TaxID=1901 RepID=B5GYU3_STRCL|nr:polysaccharide deacetylase family protein [Streptomyces clavuligerus]ANW18580.1 polysaccharide deacetylase [Streptomyces clavuligerus]AXU13141.1 polysaccharide deacetylase family protein [Streptomyces clavuligerus]EDY51489.1 secreted protein [Streptomyces clavuligerus]EFG08763.1 Polysaccharide deacetylase [Streptomyces clavuligerus]MBY6303083.1 polysaccharide deacetylase family protein [Streptomyces clavuligerus]
MKRRRTAAAAAALLAALATSACTAGDGAGGGAPGPQAARRQAGPPGSPVDRAERARRTQALRAAAAAKWGLDRVPLVAPPPPAAKPELTTRAGFEVAGHDTLPPVFTTVPVTERVVFLTIDDGREKDPELLRMMSELQIPYSSFLSDYLISDDYPYFQEMRDRGTALHNHTLNHRYMPGLDYAAQKREICGQQDRLARRYGQRPPLFRPPYGNYNQDTLRAAKACGIKAVPLWAAEAFPDRMEWREWDRDLHPGDIILTHFRGTDEWDGTMPDMIRQVMRTVTEKGYAVARLEDYV